MDTSQSPGRARVSIFPLLPLCVFSLCHLKAHREARCARLALRARTKLQTTGQRQHKTTTKKHEPHSCSAHCAQHMAHSTEHTAISAQHEAKSTHCKPHKAQSTQHRARSKTTQSTEHTTQSTQPTTQSTEHTKIFPNSCPKAFPKSAKIHQKSTPRTTKKLTRVLVTF